MQLQRVNILRVHRKRVGGSASGVDDGAVDVVALVTVRDLLRPMPVPIPRLIRIRLIRIRLIRIRMESVPMIPQLIPRLNHKHGQPREQVPADQTREPRMAGRPKRTSSRRRQPRAMTPRRATAVVRVRALVRVRKRAARMAAASVVGVVGVAEDAVAVKASRAVMQRQRSTHRASMQVNPA
jgi:hypothetical protein